MKYLIVSDNHGDRQILVDLLAEFSGKVDTFIHCGDSELQPSDPFGKPIKWLAEIVITVRNTRMQRLSKRLSTRFM